MLEIEWILGFLLLGSFVGFMAGLLGLGGGGIMVPMLTSMFLLQGMAIEHVVHLALGTSMASMIVTSFASLRAHHSRGAVLWVVVKKMAGGIVLGTFLATFIASYMSSMYLAIFFAVFMAFVSLQMFLNKRPKPSRELPGSGGLFTAGTGIGVISALVAIGGGSLTIPYLAWHNVDIKKTIGTSAAIGLPIAVAGTLGYLINGWDNSSIETLTLGFVSLPAVLFMSVTSFFMAPVGAKLTHRLPINILRKTFAVLLVLLSIKMLFTVL
jgi:uncharacterized membrane protein YfcA